VLAQKHLKSSRSQTGFKLKKGNAASTEVKWRVKSLI